MAERPVFLPHPDADRLVREVSIPFVWHKGMAPSQKRKNVDALHAAAAERGLSPLLEVSSKSSERLGQRLSAFNLKVNTPELGPIPLECAFQGGKVFERGGPFVDLFTIHPRDARRDPRLRDSGPLVAFRFSGLEFPLTPKTAYYDWLYLRSLYEHRDFLVCLHGFAGFTDIEFNPKVSINCQARSCATFVALHKRGQLDYALESPEQFIRALASDSSLQPHSVGGNQGHLFGI